MEPKKIVEIAKRENTKTIAYTYTEPTVFYEYALDIMKLAKKAGLKNIWVSNGYINDAPIRKMAPFLDAINLDIKGNEEAYCNLCHGSLKPVLKSAKEFKKHGVWIEITCLIIPGHNDDPDWMETLSKWIFENLGTSCPLHLSRFSPAHEMQDADPTPLETLTQLHKIAKKHLNYVYIGNIPTETYANTICPKCGEELIIRSNYHSKILGTTCKRCGKKLEGVFE